VLSLLSALHTHMFSTQRLKLSMRPRIHAWARLHALSICKVAAISPEWQMTLLTTYAYKRAWSPSIHNSFSGAEVTHPIIAVLNAEMHILSGAVGHAPPSNECAVQGATNRTHMYSKLHQTWLVTSAKHLESWHELFRPAIPFCGGATILMLAIPEVMCLPHSTQRSSDNIQINCCGEMSLTIQIPQCASSIHICMVSHKLESN
jgi:hypothetical protein